MCALPIFGKIAAFLAEKYRVTFHWNTAITLVEYPFVSLAERSWHADRIYICSGADFETLYPDVFREKVLPKCKMQMMRITAKPENWQIGPSFCGGLYLLNYNSFAVSHIFQPIPSRNTQ